MKRQAVRRTALTGMVAATSLVSLACVPPTPPPTQNFTFKATNVTVNSSNDKGPCVFSVCVPPANDEPYAINIAFKVTIGEPGSATTQVVTGGNHWPGAFDQGPGEGGSHTFTSGEQAAAGLNGISMLDVTDLAAGNKLQVAGVWAWGMEADLYSLSLIHI